MAWSEAPAPHELLDDGFLPDPCRLLVIGCGNILRGDDAVGPVLIRQLFVRGVPDGVRLVDGGTAGMDVAFGMRGAERVVIIDASATGAAPGTVYRVPADELSDLPPIDGLHTHNFRWDHALSFSSWLLGPHKPTDITVFLVEAGQFEPGSELSAPVAAGMDAVMALIEREFYPVVSSSVSTDEARVEITEAGYLHIPAQLSATYFPGDAAVATMRDGELVLMPLISASHGGLVLKQRNAAGDRSLLISEVLGFEPVRGTFEVAWDDARGALRVLFDRTDGEAQDSSDGIRGADRGGQGGRPMGGLSPDHHAPGDRPTEASDDVLPRTEGEAGGRRDSTYGGQAPSSQEQQLRETT
jgi:hydrogenase maturation protease